MRPLIVLAVALAAAAIFALFAIAFTTGDLRYHLLTYDVPIGVPFVAFLFDRLARLRALRPRQWAVDVPILALALIRAVVPVPLISGHALFLTYAFLTSRSWVVRVTAALVMLDVAYFKLFFWDSRTLFGGILLGCVAAWLFRRIGAGERVPSETPA